MAVIITNMDMPNSCEECKEIFLDKGIIIMCGIFYKDCPLKSADDYQPVIHAKWINHTHTNGLGITFIDYECDACHEHVDTWKSVYCPNCGAKMNKESEDG